MSKMVTQNDKIPNDALSVCRLIEHINMWQQFIIVIICLYTDDLMKVSLLFIHTKMISITASIKKVSLENVMIMLISQSISIESHFASAAPCSSALGEFIVLRVEH